MGEMSKTNMDRHRSYRIGLDIGIASVGWAVLENNSQDEPIRILDLGVRIFEAAEVPKTGAALAAERRDARTGYRQGGSHYPPLPEEGSAEDVIV